MKGATQEEVAASRSYKVLLPKATPPRALWPLKNFPWSVESTMPNLDGEKVRRRRPFR